MVAYFFARQLRRYWERSERLDDGDIRMETEVWFRSVRTPSISGVFLTNVGHQISDPKHVFISPEMILFKRST